MQRARLGAIAGTCAAVAVFSCNAIVGNDDVELGAIGSGATGASGGSGGSGGVAGGSGGVGGSGGAPGGGGASGSAGAAPKLITCGAATCTVGTSICCVPNSSTPGNCWPPGTACTGLALECDGPEDCDGATLCCATMAEGGVKPVATGCQPSCTPVQRVTCGQVPAACVAGSSCQQVPDYPDYNLCVPD